MTPDDKPAKILPTDKPYTEAFSCECGHTWTRMIEDGLVVVGCPVCQREHLTVLGRMFKEIIDHDRRHR